MKKLILQFGLGCGLLITVYSTLLFIWAGDFSNMDALAFRLFDLAGYLRYFLLIFSILLAMYSFRRIIHVNPPFSRLFRLGVLLTLVVSLITGLMECTFVLISPGFYENYLTAYLHQLTISGAPAEEIRLAESAIQHSGAMKLPWVNGLFYFIQTGAVGLIVSLLFAMLLRDRDSN